MYQSLLYATDLLEGARRMCAKATQIAKAFDASLTLLHVVEPPVSTQYAQALGFAEIIEPTTAEAKMVLDALGDEFNIEPSQRLVAVGRPSFHILETANTLGVDAIIIGSHGSDNPLPHLLGSTAQKIIHANTVDVLTLRHSEKKDDNES